MPDSTYKIIELVGTSEKSWEDAANNAIQSASALKEMRIAEVKRLDMKMEAGKPVLYRTRIEVSFKYLKED